MASFKNNKKADVIAQLAKDWQLRPRVTGFAPDKGAEKIALFGGVCLA